MLKYAKIIIRANGPTFRANGN